MARVYNVVGGWIPDIQDQRDLSFSTTKGSVLSLPRTKTFASQMPPVYDQKNLGSCTAQAARACLQFTEKEQVGGGKRPVPSALFIYFNTRVLQGSVKSDSGASLRNTFKALAGSGYCPERYWPYQVKSFDVKPSKEAYDQALPHRLTSVQYQRVSPSLSLVKACLAEDNPIAFGFPVYESFDQVGTTGSWVEPGRRESMLGGHAVVACGYSEDNESILCRNSWGKDWGLSGYFWMSYDFFLAQASDLWTLKAVPQVRA